MAATISHALSPNRFGGIFRIIIGLLFAAAVTALLKTGPDTLIGCATR